jgi:hypothetical protein
MSVSDVMRLSMVEINDWQRFAVSHPFPVDLIDIHMAVLSCIVANSNRSSNSPPFEVTEFTLIGRKPPPKEDEAARILKMFGGG